MSVDARTTSYGAPAYAALVDAVAGLKDGRPLRQVRVVVAMDRIGVNARRALARGAAGGPGVAALQVCTVRRLAEQLAGLRLARQGRRPLTSPVLAAVVRDVLIRQPGLFAPVARHPATVLAVAGAHRTLRVLTEEELGGRSRREDRGGLRLMDRPALDDLPAVIDVPPAATILGIGRTSAYELVRTGQWPTPVLRLGRLIRITSAPLRALLDAPAEP